MKEKNTKEKIKEEKKKEILLTHLNESNEEEKDVGIFAELLKQKLGQEGQKVVLGSAASGRESL